MGFPYKYIAIAISKIDGFVGFEVRHIFYKKTLKACGDNLRIHHGAYIVYPDVSIGNRCTIEENSIISLCDIGDDVIVAANVSIMSGGNQHETDNLNVKFHDSNLPLKRVKLGRNIWIGTHSVIMADLADGCILGAGAVLTKDATEINAIYAGVPAKLIRKRGA
ncbi:hypothetical protein KAM479c_16600 (plasmid) [Aeromonas caviae]|nr:hypothetical protein KAM479c_16600 [Aeromonas caviae]